MGQVPSKCKFVSPAFTNVSPFFSSIQAAINAAVAGDLVVVYPGTYEEQIILKDQVNLHLTNGVIIQHTHPVDESFYELVHTVPYPDGQWVIQGNGDATITDNGQEVHCTISGQGVIKRDGTGTTFGVAACVFTYNENSELDITCEEISGPMIDYGIWAAWGTVRANVRRVIVPTNYAYQAGYEMWGAPYGVLGSDGYPAPLGTFDYRARIFATGHTHGFIYGGNGGWVQYRGSVYADDVYHGCIGSDGWGYMDFEGIAVTNGSKLLQRQSGPTKVKGEFILLGDSVLGAGGGFVEMSGKAFLEAPSYDILFLNNGMALKLLRMSIYVKGSPNANQKIIKMGGGSRLWLEEVTLIGGSNYVNCLSRTTTTANVVVRGTVRSNLPVDTASGVVTQGDTIDVSADYVSPVEATFENYIANHYQIP